MAQITLKNISKKWGQNLVVADQSLTIADQEFLVLLGPSGCGKTTTMRMIAGLEEPSTGDIWIGDRWVNDDLPKDRDIAMVFQNYGLYPHMRVYDNIAYPLKVRGTAVEEIDPRVKKAAAQVELSDYLDRKPRALSGGQRQRVALARAIIRTPKVFLMDEPLSNLDAKLRVTMRAELKHLSRALKITTLYVTHDQVEAMTLADRVAVMHAGRIQQLGTPDEIYNEPANMFVASFIGSPAMNLIHGGVFGGWFVTSEDKTRIAIDAQDTPKAVLGFRADDVHIASPEAEDAIPVEIYSFENTGENTLLTLKLGQQRVILRGNRHLRFEQGEMVKITLDSNRLYLFDQKTGKRIKLQPTA